MYFLQRNKTKNYTVMIFDDLNSWGSSFGHTNYWEKYNWFCHDGKSMINSFKLELL